MADCTSQYDERGGRWNANPVMECRSSFRRGLRTLFRCSQKRLSQLMEQSNRILSPLADPLDLDLGAHRWLRASREEAYSDWLAWILEQLRTPPPICKIFAVAVPQKLVRASVKREHTVSQGHEGCQGRLDILLRHDDVPYFAIEVKLGGADGADVLKHQGYAVSLPKETHKILLATEGEVVDVYGFQLRRWEDVTVNHRETIADSPRLPLCVQAMMLAFIGAVEQNLLGYPGNITPYLATHRTFPTSIVQHIEAMTGGTSR